MGFDELWVHIARAMWRWEEWKFFLEHSIAFSSDSLHVIAGVVALLIIAGVSRMPISSSWPVLSVLALEALNEFADLTLERWPHRGMQYGESMRDVLLTMTLPAILFLSARVRPQIFSRTGSPRR
jgi:hypothetical protein